MVARRHPPITPSKECSSCPDAVRLRETAAASMDRSDDASGEASPHEPLTDRQLEILVQVARGRTNREVGRALGISERTVRNHLRTISKKLSTSDRTRAVVLSIERGWIAIPLEPESTPASEEQGAESPARSTLSREP